MELIFSTTAGGNVFSIPKTMPIFLTLTGHSSPRVAHLKITPLSLVTLERSQGHPEASLIDYRRQAFSRCSHAKAYRATCDRQGQSSALKILPRHLQPQR